MPISITYNLFPMKVFLNTKWTASEFGVFYLVCIFCIRTEYGDLQIKSPYSVQTRENTDQKKLQIGTFFTQLPGSNGL